MISEAHGPPTSFGDGRGGGVRSKRERQKGCAGFVRCSSHGGASMQILTKSTLVTEQRQGGSIIIIYRMDS